MKHLRTIRAAPIWLPEHVAVGHQRHLLPRTRQDDALGYAILEAERRTDRRHPCADLHFARFAPGRGMKRRKNSKNGSSSGRSGNPGPKLPKSLFRSACVVLMLTTAARTCHQRGNLTLRVCLHAGSALFTDGRQGLFRMCVPSPRRPTTGLFGAIPDAAGKAHCGRPQA
jgi:hypothetical protein